MSWDDIDDREIALSESLSLFDWPAVTEQCTELVQRIKTDSESFPELSAKRVMNALRRKRRLGEMRIIAEALLQFGLTTPLIRRQYGQALIEQGEIFAAEGVLRGVIQDHEDIVAEEFEARGLMGRIYKQTYVNNQDPRSPANQRMLKRALEEYWNVYHRDPNDHLWHGINVVALLARAARDEVQLGEVPEPDDIAKNILAVLKERERQSTTDLPAYDVATQMEAQLALRSFDDAVKTAARYVEKLDADAFELNSTLRQLTEVWQLDFRKSPGDKLLPILKSGLLRKEGGGAGLDPRKVAEEAASLCGQMEGLEAILGDTRMVTLKWYKQGLDQCSSVARVEKPDGNPHGTGWLVNASDFFPERTGVLLLTNHHVVTDDKTQYRSVEAIDPGDARINFQALTLPEPLRVKEGSVWSSPVPEYDATFLELEGEVPAKPLRIYTKELLPTKPMPRLYVIGHPRGGDMAISMQDNYFLAAKERYTHYRSPTEKGSSGSPVFEPLDWRVTALHHKGSKTMPCLDDPTKTHPANEGISILAIQAATKARSVTNS